MRNSKGVDNRRDDPAEHLPVIRRINIIFWEAGDRTIYLHSLRQQTTTSHSRTKLQHSTDTFGEKTSLRGKPLF
jgi:hypothetical protein